MLAPAVCSRAPIEEFGLQLRGRGPAFASVTGTPRAALSIAHARLLLADMAQPDDRSQSACVLSVGADWRSPDGACRGNICTGVGIGKFIKPTVSWRAAVMHTMSQAELTSLPLPPKDIFLSPDGTYPSD